MVSGRSFDLARSFSARCLPVRLGRPSSCGRRAVGRPSRSGPRITRDALRGCPYDLPANDDGNLRLLFQLLERADLLEQVAMGYETLAAFRASTPERIRAEPDAYLAAHGKRTSRMIDYGSFVWQARRLEDMVEG